MNNHSSNSLRCISLMSGTSTDGVDAVIVDFSQGPVGLKADVMDFQHFAFSVSYPARAAEVIDAQNMLQAFQLGQALAQEYTRVIIELLQSHQLTAQSIAFVAVSGHTLLHQPPTEQTNGLTIDTTDLSMIAALTKIPVIGKFRQKDIALGGHGAPLVPLPHRYIFGDSHPYSIIQNIGGIGNLTLLENASAQLGFDTGPGNTWIDQTIKWHTQDQQSFDQDGQLAGAGSVDHDLVGDLLQHPFFQSVPPKSTGIKTIGYPYLHLFKERLLSQNIRDALATVTYATAKSIADAYQNWVFSTYSPTEIIVCGGGAHNKTLLAMLQSQVSSCPVIASQSLDIDPSSVEALAFAFLGWFRWQNKINVLSKLTGSIQDNIGGEIAGVEPL